VLTTVLGWIGGVLVVVGALLAMFFGQDHYGTRLVITGLVCCIAAVVVRMVF
jgi:hypothetical protein